MHTSYTHTYTHTHTQVYRKLRETRKQLNKASKVVKEKRDLLHEVLCVFCVYVCVCVVCVCVCVCVCMLRVCVWVEVVKEKSGRVI